MKKYSYDDLKNISIRIGRNINKNIQKSNLNESIKKYFTENSLSYIDNDNKFIGLVINENALDNLEIFKNISKSEYISNMKTIYDIARDAIKHESLNLLFELKSINNGKEKILCGNENISRYKNLYIGLRESSSTSDIERQFIDDRKKDNHYADYQEKKYYKVPNNIARSTTLDLIDEIHNERDKQKRIHANIMGRQNDDENKNSSRYDFTDLNQNKIDLDI